MSPFAVDVGQEQSPGSGHAAAGPRSAALSAGFARLVGEMDAELRVELNSRIKLLATELRSEILSEAAAKVAGLEAKASAADASLQSRLQRLAEDVALCLSSREESLQLVQKVSSLEGDVKMNSGILSAFLDEQRKKATVTAVDEVEAAVQLGMCVDPRAPNQSRTPPVAPTQEGIGHTRPSSVGRSLASHGRDAEAGGAEASRPGFADYPAKDRLQGLISAIDRERSIDNALDKLQRSTSLGPGARTEDEMPETRVADSASTVQHHSGQHVEDPLHASRGNFSVASVGNPQGTSANVAAPVRRDHHDQRRAALADGTDMATQSWPGAEARCSQSPGAGAAPSSAAQAGQPAWHGGVQWPLRGSMLAAAPGHPVPGQPVAVGQPGAQAAPPPRRSVQQLGGCPAQAGLQSRMSGGVPLRASAYPGPSGYTIYR
ncbi:unnamed protein product [Prorocentrum cordatum]|uniref:Uncharacterized protein n=1 Tax=Prorocentrum cordatum TaxID=2364126 RepID=A0ABN9S8F1_9DINO|nr:unnamed protein product [Polarella glacialis]